MMAQHINRLCSDVTSCLWPYIVMVSIYGNVKIEKIGHVVMAIYSYEPYGKHIKCSHHEPVVQETQPEARDGPAEEGSPHRQGGV